MSKIHICLVSDQLLPNLIPILSDKPTKVYLVSSQVMSDQGKDVHLRRLLRQRDIDVEIRKKAPSAGIEEIRKFAKKICGQVIAKGLSDGVVLNATGGTKLLSMGFVEVFRRELEGYPLQVIYTDTEHQVIEYVVPQGRTSDPMQAVLDVPMYLEAQGMRLKHSCCEDDEWKRDANNRKTLTEYLASHCTDLESLFGVLNGLVHGVGGRPGVFLPGGKTLGYHPKQHLKSRPSGEWRRALGKMKKYGLIGWNGDKEIKFLSTESACFLSGGWLEEFAWHTARAADLGDVRCSAQCQWIRYSGEDAPRNEFDVVAVHNNRLLLVECKTGSLEREHQNVVSKLESLGRNAGGLFGASLFLTVKEPPLEMRQRLKSLGILCLAGKDMARLGEALLKWRTNEAFSF